MIRNKALNSKTQLSVQQQQNFRNYQTTE